jgi:hypothetical protein
LNRCKREENEKRRSCLVRGSWASNLLKVSAALKVSDLLVSFLSSFPASSLLFFHLRLLPLILFSLHLPIYLFVRLFIYSFTVECFTYENKNKGDKFVPILRNGFDQRVAEQRFDKLTATIEGKLCFLCCPSRAKARFQATKR